VQSVERVEPVLSYVPIEKEDGLVYMDLVMVAALGEQIFNEILARLESLRAFRIQVSRVEYVARHYAVGLALHALHTVPKFDVSGVQVFELRG
jgi:hypothetical protein